MMIMMVKAMVMIKCSKLRKEEREKKMGSRQRYI
jgi:hypothetical protein